MRSTRMQLLVTLLAAAIAAGLFIHHGLPPQESAYEGLYANDVSYIRRCLAWGIDANMKTPILYFDSCVISPSGRQECFYETESLLSAAAGGGREDVVGLLIEAGADLNARGERGPNYYGTSTEGSLWYGAHSAPPLHAAVREGHLRLAEMLIEAGADISIRDLDGRTPLGVAEANQNQQMIDLLLKHGAKE